MEIVDFPIGKLHLSHTNSTIGVIAVSMSK